MIFALYWVIFLSLLFVFRLVVVADERGKDQVVEIFVIYITLPKLE
jgi:hypothetical protein